MRKTKHSLKQRSKFYQILELFTIPISLITMFWYAYKDGKLKYCIGNFTVNLRKPYAATLVYPWSLKNYFLHRLGMTLMDPFGNFFKKFYLENKYVHHSGAEDYIGHFNPIVNKMVKKYIEDKTNKIEASCPDYIERF